MKNFPDPHWMLLSETLIAQSVEVLINGDGELAHQWWERSVLVEPVGYEAREYAGMRLQIK